MNVNKYIYSRPNKANRTDLHCAINYWSEVEEQSVGRTGKIGLIVVELWSFMSKMYLMSKIVGKYMYVEIDIHAMYVYIGLRIITNAKKYIVWLGI